MNGLTATSTRGVSAQAGHYIRITSNIESGIAPLEVCLRIESSFSVTNPQITSSGTATMAWLPLTSATEPVARITSEGTVAVTASAIGPDGQTYSDSVTITAINRTKLESLLKGKWEGMKQKITAGDIQGAGSYFYDASRDMFQAIFNDPSMEIMSRLNEISEIKIYTIKDDTAQGGAIRQENDGIYAYPVNFTRDDNGIWRIYGF